MQCEDCHKNEVTWIKKPLIGKKKYLCFSCVVSQLNGGSLMEPLEVNYGM